MPGDAAPVVKIGVIAPFEGLGRPFGYAVLPAVKEAIGAANVGGELGPYRVELVALDDSLDPRAAAAQAAVLAQDPNVVAVLGPFDSATAQAGAPILARAGIPTLLAAPLADPLTAVRSLCPSPVQLAAALDEALRGREGSFLHAGDAASAAAELVRREMAGEPGVLVGGPDLLRPWLIARAGPVADGTQAVACAPEGLVVPGAAGQAADLSLAHAAALASNGTSVLLRALVEDIAVHGRPSRSGVAAALAARSLMPGLTWYQVRRGKWEQQRSAVSRSEAQRVEARSTE